MEDLTKQQMVLLTVLVSFVCSIATSIMIVSLLTDTVAPTISQTINRVVEKTIERVVTGSSTPIFVKPTSVVPVVSESEKVISAISENLSKMVVIRDKIKEGESATSTQKIGIGTVVSSDGLIATDSSLLGEKTEFIVFLGDKYQFAKKVYYDTGIHLAILQAGAIIKDDKNTEGITFSPLTYWGGDMNLGTPIIALGGENGKTISRGILTEIPEKKSSPILVGEMMLTSLYKGGIVFGLDGKVVGIILSNSDGVSQIIHYSNILSSLGEYKNIKSEAVKP